MKRTYILTIEGSEDEIAQMHEIAESHMEREYDITGIHYDLTEVKEDDSVSTLDILYKTSTRSKT